MSGGLAKACVPRKNYSVPEKLEFPTEPMCLGHIHCSLHYGPDGVGKYGVSINCSTIVGPSLSRGIVLGWMHF